VRPVPQRQAIAARALAPFQQFPICIKQSMQRARLMIREHEVDSVIHFAASAIVPESVKDPLGYYKNNTVNSRALIETNALAGSRNCDDMA